MEIAGGRVTVQAQTEPLEEREEEQAQTPSQAGPELCPALLGLCPWSLASPLHTYVETPPVCPLQRPPAHPTHTNKTHRVGYAEYWFISMSFATLQP